MMMTEPAGGVWVSLTEAAVSLGCSTDTVRRRIKMDPPTICFKMERGRYLVHLEKEQALASPLPIVVQTDPTVQAMLEFMREEREYVRQELEQLREKLARAHADLAVAQSRLPTSGKRWSLFEWMSQRWAAQ